MPRYYFSASDGEADDVGTELADHAAARRFAIQYAGEVMTNQPSVLWDGLQFDIVVTDERRKLLFTVRMVAINAPAAGDTK